MVISFFKESKSIPVFTDIIKNLNLVNLATEKKFHFSQKSQIPCISYLILRSQTFIFTKGETIVARSLLT